MLRFDFRPLPMYKFGLIGYPLSHSLSPQIHGAALSALGVSGEYALYPVPPIHREVVDETPDALTLSALMDQIRTAEMHGLNVTIPHKENVIPLMDELTPAAAAIGAVNTIYLRAGVLIGDNTDAPSFWGDLQQLHSFAQHKAPRALILGSGGGARAVVYALLNRGFHITISARCEDQTQAETLVEDLGGATGESDRLKIICLDTDYHTLETTDFSLLVNCTPVGMHPHVEESPWPDYVPLPPHAAVYDLVYNPRETQLSRQARAAGLPARTGLGMLVEQAALAFERWTGLEAPRAVMLDAVSG